MTRKRKPEIVVDSEGRSWDLDDFDLDSLGVEAPIKDRLEMLRQSGLKPEQVGADIKDRYTKYLEKMKKRHEKP